MVASQIVSSKSVAILRQKYCNFIIGIISMVTIVIYNMFEHHFFVPDDLIWVIVSESKALFCKNKSINAGCL